jgi:hypothetical protein
LELGSAHDFFDAEFRKNGAIELDLSVFELDDDATHVTQTQAEFNVSFKSPPPRDPCTGVNVAGLDGFQVYSSDGETEFEFTRTRHRELRFVHDEELLGIAESLLANQGTRAHRTSRSDIQRYIRARFAAGDPEWFRVLGQRTNWTVWACPPERRATKGPSTGAQQGAHEGKAPEHLDGNGAPATVQTSTAADGSHDPPQPSADQSNAAGGGDQAVAKPLEGKAESGQGQSEAS